MTRTNRLIGKHQRLNTPIRNGYTDQRHTKTDVNWPGSKRSNELTRQQVEHTVVQYQCMITSESKRRINMDKQFGTFSMQMPSTITRRRALECRSKGNETMPDRLANRHGKSDCTNRDSLARPARGFWFGDGGRLGSGKNFTVTLTAGLLYQIVIISLILHTLPTLVDSTRMTIAEASSGSGSSNGMQTPGQLTGTTNNLHSSGSSSISSVGPNQRQRRHNLIETSLIYTSELALNSNHKTDRFQQVRQRHHTTSEPQRQQQSPPSPPLKLTGGQTKGSTSRSSTTYDSDEHEGENNWRRHNQSSALSFIEKETVNESLLDGLMRTGDALVKTRQRSLSNTAQPYKRSRRHAGPVDDPHLDDKLDGHQSDALDNQRVGLSAGRGATSTAPDCKKLATLWLYLHSSYPLLASHLIELGMGAKDSQLARSIKHLLEEAERLIAATAADSLGVPLGQRTPPAWLARVSSHPAYGKLVQHLRAKQLDKNNHLLNNQHQNNRHQHQPLLEVTKGASPANGQDSAASVSTTEVVNAEGDQMSGLMGQMAPSREAYGRIVHYPHEIGSTDNSNGMARTRDKLRLLKHQQRQAVRSDGNIVEVNKISATLSENDRHKLTDSVANRARNNFVYGTVLLQPHGPDDDEGLDGTNNNNNHRQSPTATFNHNKPISTLRELAYEGERQRLAQLSGRALPALQLETSSRTTGNDQSPPRSYGHILTSPPNDSRGLGGGNNNNNYHDNIDKSEQAIQSEVAADELANQQFYGRTAAEDGDGDEFEGEFHSSPLKQAEIRMLRSLDGHQDGRGSRTIELAAGVVGEDLGRAQRDC